MSEVMIPRINDRVYRLGTGSPGNSILFSGWGEPERGFVWSEGTTTALHVPAWQGQKSLTFTVWGYVPSGSPAQDLLVFVDGILKGIFSINEQTLVPVPLNGYTTERDIEVVFYIPFAGSPKQKEGKDDHRRLGIALSVVQSNGS